MEQPKPQVIDTMREKLKTDIKLQEEELIGHSKTLEGIRETLLKEVLLQEGVRTLFKKIIRRLSFIYVSAGILLLMGIGLIIYMLNQPVSSMKQVQEMQKNIIEQRKFIERDRQDVAKARAQLIEGIKIQDSLVKHKK